MPEDSLLTEDPVQSSLVPVFGYQSDAGFIGGAVWQRIDYESEQFDFGNVTSMELSASTMGHLSGKFDHERTESFGGRVRSRYRVELFRIPNLTYFGIGNRTTFDPDLYNEGWYDFMERSIRFQYTGRVGLSGNRTDGQLDLQFLLSVSGYSPRPAGEASLFEESKPTGYNGGWANRIGAGFILDHRDSEFNPTRGFRLESSLSGAGGVTLSRYRFGLYMIDGRAYIPLGRDLVIAQRVELQHTFGETPFQEMPTLGSELALRGYALNRFRAYTALHHQLELRSWLFSVLNEEIRFGAQLFMDTGRVFSEGESLGDLPDGLKQTFGVGGVMSLFNPDFIFRGELGFSDELYRIYIGIGYLF